MKAFIQDICLKYLPETDETLGLKKKLKSLADSGSALKATLGKRQPWPETVLVSSYRDDCTIQMQYDRKSESSPIFLKPPSEE